MSIDRDDDRWEIRESCRADWEQDQIWRAEEERAAREAEEMGEPDDTFDRLSGAPRGK